MLPLKDDIPARHFPFINIGLIGINILVFLFELSQRQNFDRLIMSYGFVPARFSSSYSWEILDFSRYGTIFSSMFLHGSLFHLLSNMWVLWIFGDNVEDCMGRGRYVIFFLLCGMASVLAQTMANPTSQLPLIGASGAISGVLGAYFLTYPRARVLTLVPIFILFYLVNLPAYIFLGLWFLLQFLSGYSSLTASAGGEIGGIAWWAHVGGFGTGMMLIPFFRQKELCQPYNRAEKRIRRISR
jgi:membrane associated rhomboid family serine protease